MLVYRLENEDNHGSGPFSLNADEAFKERIGMGKQRLTPAEAAQAIAVAVNTTGPFDMPNIQHDGVTFEEFERFQRRHGPLVFGFASLEQYREWFPHKLEREILFKRVRLNGDGHERAPSGMELRCFEVPDNLVLKGAHQVAFPLFEAIEGRVTTRKEAIG